MKYLIIGVLLIVMLDGCMIGHAGHAGHEGHAGHFGEQAKESEQE